jgi:uroporphyrinogen-III synthase
MRQTPPAVLHGPLAGRRILVTRPRAQSAEMLERLRALGARAVAVPAIRIAHARAGGPFDRALRRLDLYDWVVVTSANGARACLARARALGVDLAAARPRWAAIGPATATALADAGVAVAMMPTRYLTDAMSRELRVEPGQRVLLPRTDAAPPGLAETLRARGVSVDEITAYRTVLAPAQSRRRVRELVEGGEVDTVVFTSASTVRGFMRLVGDATPALGALAIACIGPVTAAAVREAGLRPTVVAHDHTVDGIIAALVAHETTARMPEGAPHAQDRAAR